MPQNSEISADPKKTLIQNAAIKLFVQFGFAKTTLDDIAESVGMKKASLYYYYNSKEELFRDVVGTVTGKFLEQLENEVANEKNVKSKLTKFITLHLDYFEQMMNLHNVSISASLEFKPLIDQFYKEFYAKRLNIISKIINNGVENGELKDCDTEKVSCTIFSVFESLGMLALQRSKLRGEVDFKKLEDDQIFLINILIDGLKK